MEYTRIKYSVDRRIATITLSRPEHQNALDDAMVNELSHALHAANKSSSIRVILLKGEGDVFCSGTDPDVLRRLLKYEFDQNLDDSKAVMKLFVQIYTLRTPVIAVVRGPALASGCGLMAVCDLVIASRETARLGFPEVTLGFVPALALEFLSRRIGEGKARELAMLGTILTADEAATIGLVNQVVPETELDEHARSLAQRLAETTSPAAIGLVKELLSRVHGMSTNDALEYAANLSALSRMTDECRRGLNAVLKDEGVKW
jgi:methylglutaconyl-CoA hydratase